ncbi:MULTISPECIES: universal stress protein [Citricoccus]|uniref:universal stress protein n=1 Tax=Citricoccus TaxID=169133 RepID=UPI000255F255|nr:universal stress protein [Citricoccus sp. CH26A]
MGEAVKPVVVGVDGSETSVEALKEAGRMAALLGAPLKVVTAWHWSVVAAAVPAPDAQDFRGRAQEAVDQAITAAFGDDVPEGLERVVREGPPAQVLRDLSKDASLVVVGNRGHGGFAGLLLGSVSSAVAAHAHCSVLITHKHGGDGGR